MANIRIAIDDDRKNAIALRVGYSNGSSYFEDLIKDKRRLKVGGTTGKGETITKNGITTMHLGKEYGTGKEEQLRLAVLLEHEGFRDGKVTKDNVQETVEAVLGHTEMAKNLASWFGGSFLNDNMRTDIKQLNKALAAEDMSQFEMYASTAYDSSSDFWKLMDNGDMIEDGDGWLRDQNGNYKLDGNGNKIGAEGIETGLLNILNGGTSGVAYSKFSDAEILSAQRLLTNSGFNSSGGKDFHNFMWNRGNDGKTLNSNSILTGFGDTVVAPVLMNGLDSLSNSVVNGLPNSIASLFVPGKARGRFNNFVDAKIDFYGGTHELLSSETIGNSRVSGWFDSDEHYADDQHKGGDIAAQKGESITGDPILAYFGGKVVDIRNNTTSSGNSAFVEHGFNFENHFYSTGVRSQYMHMEKNPAFKINDMVTANTQMGTLGNTGDSTGPHIHWQLMGDRAANTPTSENWNMYSDRRDTFLSQVGGIPSSSWSEYTTSTQNYWAGSGNDYYYNNFYYNINPILESFGFEK